MARNRAGDENPRSKGSATTGAKPAFKAQAVAGSKYGTASAPKPKPKAKRKNRPAPPPVDLRAALPYFLARIAVFIVISFVLLVAGLSVLLALLGGMVGAAVIAWPLARMQRRAARPSAEAGSTTATAKAGAPAAGSAGRTGTAPGAGAPTPTPTPTPTAASAAAGTRSVKRSAARKAQAAQEAQAAQTAKAAQGEAAQGEAAQGEAAQGEAAGGPGASGATPEPSSDGSSSGSS
jgi:hypothetical protein